MIIVLLGPPGAGKGTQGERIAAVLGVPKIATGDVLRAAVRDGTPMGLAAKGYMDRGDLVPDAVILGIMTETLAATDDGAILDGVVRTVNQAIGLEQAVEGLGRRVDAVLVFDIDDEELVRRLSGRTVCDLTQKPFTGLEPGSPCPDGSGGILVRRADDEPDAVRHRLSVYREQTKPVIDWYCANGTNVATINAVGSLEEVEARALSALGR